MPSSTYYNSSPSPEGYQNFDTMFYKHGNQIVQKRSWRDPNTGDEWPTFDVVAQGNYDWLKDGDVVDPSNLSDPRQSTLQSAVPAAQGKKSKKVKQPKQPKQPQVTASGMQAGTYGGVKPMAQQTEFEQQRQQAGQSDGSQSGPQTRAITQGPINAVAPQGDKNRMLYDPMDGNARQAYQNAMLASGININGWGNPYLKRLKAMQDGAVLSFLMNQASSGTPSNADTGANFVDYLRNSMQSPSGLSGTIGGAADSLPGMVDQLKQYQQGQMGGGSPMNVYMQALGDMLDSNNGLTQAMYSLRSPLMGSGLAQAYRWGLTQLGDTAERRQAEAGDFAPGSLWDYILGRR